MPYVIAEPCINVKDKACVEVCPVDCIYEGDTQLFIHPDECIDCGACEPVCPVKAIFAEDETPDQWKSFIELNKQVLQGQSRRQAGHQVVASASRSCNWRRALPRGPFVLCTVATAAGRRRRAIGVCVRRKCGLSGVAQALRWPVA